MLNEIADDLEPELLRLLARPPMSWPPIDDRSLPWFTELRDSDRPGSTIWQTDFAVRRGIGFLVRRTPEHCHPESDWRTDRRKLPREAIWEVEGLGAPERLYRGTPWPTAGPLAAVGAIRLVRKLPSWRLYGQQGEAVDAIVEQARSVPPPSPVAASYRSPAFRDRFFAALRATNSDPVVKAMEHAWRAINLVMTERADRHDPATILWLGNAMGGETGSLDDPSWRWVRDELTMSAVQIIAGT